MDAEFSWFSLPLGGRPVNKGSLSSFGRFSVRNQHERITSFSTTHHGIAVESAWESGDVSVVRHRTPHAIRLALREPVKLCTLEGLPTLDCSGLSAISKLASVVCEGLLVPKGYISVGFSSNDSFFSPTRLSLVDTPGRKIWSRARGCCALLPPFSEIPLVRPSTGSATHPQSLPPPILSRHLKAVKEDHYSVLCLSIFVVVAPFFIIQPVRVIQREAILTQYRGFHFATY